MSDAAKANSNVTLARQRQMLSSNAAADYCGLGRSTLPKMRMRGDGPRYCKLGGPVGGRVLYDVADLDAYIEASKRTSTAA